MPDDPPEKPVDNLEPRCRNCNELLSGEYCSNCGQRDQKVIKFFPTILAESFDGIFTLNSRTYNTLGFLLTRPAFLSNEYLRGKRVRYLPPFRLFLIFVLVFIFTISLEIFLDAIGIDLDNGNDEEIATTLETIEEETDGTFNRVSGDTVRPENPNDEDFGFELSAEEGEFNEYLNEAIGNIRIPIISEQNNQRFVAMLQARAEDNISAIREDPMDFVNELLDYVPVLMLFLLPWMALIQKVAYLGSGRYYVEHLILTIHNHSFLFLVFILMFLLDVLATFSFDWIFGIIDFTKSLLSLWIVLYLYLSLKFFSRQGYLLTFFKFLIASIAYGVSLFSGLFAMMLIAFFVY